MGKDEGRKRDRAGRRKAKSVHISKREYVTEGVS